MHCFACNKYEPGNLEVDGSNPDIGQTFSYCPWVAGKNRIGKGEREGEFGKGSKKEKWESGSYMKYRSLGSNMSSCSLQPRGNMTIRKNLKGTLCRPAGHKNCTPLLIFLYMNAILR
jgi:hypothetical protein